MNEQQKNTKEERKSKKNEMRETKCHKSAWELIVVYVDTIENLVLQINWAALQFVKCEKRHFTRPLDYWSIQFSISLSVHRASHDTNVLGSYIYTHTRMQNRHTLCYVLDCLNSWSFIHTRSMCVRYAHKTNTKYTFHSIHIGLSNVRILMAYWLTSSYNTVFVCISKNKTTTVFLSFVFLLKKS